MERKLLKHGAEEFKPGFAMPPLTSSPCEITWKNKGCILPVCRAHQEAKAKGFFLLKKIRLWSVPWDMVKWGGACQSSPVFHMAITPAQIRKTYLVLYPYPAGSNPRSRLSLPGQMESTICPSHNSLVCEIVFLVAICLLCMHVYFWDLPHIREIPPNFYCMMSKWPLLLCHLQ